MKNDSLLSLFRWPYISRSILLLGASGLMVLAVAFFMQQINDNSTCDAGGYAAIAMAIKQKGVLAVRESERTFIYPSLLALLMRVSEVTRIPAIFLTFLIQLTIYYLAILFISNVLFVTSKKLAEAVYLGLCFNIFVIPYTGITLTDSFYTTIAILIFGSMIKMEELQQNKKIVSAKWVYLIVLLMSIGITTRPAAIWLAIPICYLLVRMIISKSISIPFFLLACFLGAVPLYFQTLLNIVHFHKITFFPACDLGAMQLKEGIKNIKYATWLGGGNAANYYSSKSLFFLHSHELGISWYFYYPIDAVKLLFLKFIGAFDFDYLLVYPHHKEKIKWLPSFFSFSILWLGLLSVCVHCVTNRLSVLGSRCMPGVIFLGWCSITLLSALELRFTLPLLSYFIISGLALVYHVTLTKSKKLMLIIVIGWIFLLPIFYSISMFVRMQSLHS